MTDEERCAINLDTMFWDDDIGKTKRRLLVELSEALGIRPGSCSWDILLDSVRIHRELAEQFMATRGKR